MGIQISDFLSLLNQPPCNLIYHLVVGLTWVLILLAAGSHINESEKRLQVRHVMIGAFILLAIQIILFTLDFLPVPGIQNQGEINAIIQRFAGALLVLWLAWTYLQPQQPFLFTGISIFISLALTFFLGVTFFVLRFPPLAFLGLAPLLPIMWEMITLLLIVVAIILILVNKPEQWSIALAILITLMAGYLLQILIPAGRSQQMGLVRLAKILGLPWSIALLQRYISLKPAEQIEESNETSQKAAQKVDTKPTLVDELLQIALREDLEERFQAVARAMSYSAISDICYIARIPEQKDTIELVAGYDLIREEITPTATYPRDSFLHIMDAWEDQHSLTLSEADQDTRDAVTLTLLLRYHRIGHLFAFPLSLPGRDLVGGVIFLSPYTDKTWGRKTQALMDEINQTLAAVLFEPTPSQQYQEALKRAKTREMALNADKKALTTALTKLGATLDEQETTLKQLKAKFQIERLEILKELNTCREKRQSLTSQIEVSKSRDLELEQLTAEIRQLIRERDQLKMDLSRANARIRELEHQTGQTGPIRLSIDSQVLSLDSAVANLKLEMAPRLQDKNLELELINPDGRQMIRTDPALYQSVLLGLLENAVQASEQSARIQLKQNLSFETGMLMVQVTDFGKGLTQAEQQALFNAEAASLPGIGSLSSIRDAIRAIRILNGKIWIKSQKNAFTTFRVQLPVRILD